MEGSRPIAIAIAGSAGTGKSTVAKMVAAALGAEVVHADIVRETLRAVMPDGPVHRSSFELLAPDFVAQSRQVCVGVRAAIERYLAKGLPVVAEGVNLVPGMLKPVVALHVVIDAPSAEEHVVRLRSRDHVGSAARYVERYGGIVAVQHALEAEARRTHTFVLPNRDAGATAQEILDLLECP